MSMQTRWLFEAPLVQGAIQYSPTYYTEEYYRNSELERGPHPPFFKDWPELQRVSLAPAPTLSINHTWSSLRQNLARTYNRLGGLMQALARMVGIDIASGLAVWYVESGSRSHIPGRAIIRFENHLFYRNWGKFNENIYNLHFRHGGHLDLPGKAWLNHQFRKNTTDPWQNVHIKGPRSQEREYEVLNVAIRLAGQDPALRSISIGGPQILITNHSRIGYSSPRQMFDAFQASERFHVLGFFDFCRRGNLLRFLRARQWADFARRYNGSGQIQRYAAHLSRAYQEASQLPLPKF
jgi:hypothetical protein